MGLGDELKSSAGATATEESVTGFKAWLGQFVPPIAIDFAITIIVIIAAVLFVTQNERVLRLLGKLTGAITRWFSKLFGHRVRNFNTKLLRSAYLNKESLQYTIVKYFEDMIMNLDLQKDGVTVSGLLFFLLGSAAILTAMLNSLMSFGMLLPIIYCAVVAILFIMFRLLSVSQLEKREEMIMDAVDFLVSDIKGGVFNAMMRYEHSFNPNIRTYFSECIDDIKNKGASFEEAMLKLNAQLGPMFTDFAYKSIIYEAKADEGLEDLFSSIIETNRNRRNLRYINNIEFNSLRLEFLISVGMILAYGGMFMATDKWAMHFLTTTFLGRLMIIADVIIIAAVMGFITNIKAKSL